MVTSWTLRARDAALADGEVVSDWSATLVERWNFPDTLQVNGRTADLRPLFTLEDGTLTLDGGVTLEDDSGRRFSGVLSALTRRRDRTCTVTFESDLIHLWDRIAYPQPCDPITGQDTDYGDVQTSVPAETALLHYIDKNAGPGALTAREVLGLVVPASLGRGGTIANLTARLDILGVLVADIASAAGLRIAVVQDGADLNVTITESPDLTATARYGDGESGGPGLLGDWTYTLTKPTVTTAEVAGGDEGINRKFRERTDAAAETRWGRRIEALVDQRQTLVVAELDKAGDDALADGAQPVEIEANVLDDPDQRLGVDVPLGALVALDLDGVAVADRLRKVTTTISAARGTPTVVVTGVVGSSDAGLTLSQKEFLAMRKTFRKVVAR